ncbi:hypothetical protein RFI_26566 [Reticulomyxa filosa]|uniref:Uncharacterized protein n=1 Tax=Reticulomyxa filosa TaxID=46433 RepID=X6MCP3_RETFI|nr:hypothetical protein RFI_26566 [Reticulomyxa filosa]|eukprot:ETO10810.1 hypothetical protein RFI_26566 [Reticulomyxa filosa]
MFHQDTPPRKKFWKRKNQDKNIVLSNFVRLVVSSYIFQHSAVKVNVVLLVVVLLFFPNTFIRVCYIGVYLNNSPFFVFFFCDVVWFCFFNFHHKKQHPHMMITLFFSKSGTIFSFPKKMASFCKNSKDIQGEDYCGSRLVLLSICLFFELCCATYSFYHVFLTPPAKVLLIPLVLYHIFGIIYLIANLIEDSIAEYYSWHLNYPNYCIVFAIVAWVPPIFYYASMEIFWFSRLMITFAGTAFEFSKKMERVFQCIVVVMTALGFLGSSMIIYNSTCIERKRCRDYNLSNYRYSCGMEIPWVMYVYVAGGKMRIYIYLYTFFVFMQRILCTASLYVVRANVYIKTKK